MWSGEDYDKMTVCCAYEGYTLPNFRLQIIEAVQKVRF